MTKLRPQVITGILCATVFSCFGIWIGCGLSVPVIFVIEFLFDRASEAQMFLSFLAAGFVYTFLAKKFVYPAYERDGPSNYD